MFKNSSKVYFENIIDELSEKKGEFLNQYIHNSGKGNFCSDLGMFLNHNKWKKYSTHRLKYFSDINENLKQNLNLIDRLSIKFMIQAIESRQSVTEYTFKKLTASLTIFSLILSIISLIMANLSLNFKFSTSVNHKAIAFELSTISIYTICVSLYFILAIAIIWYSITQVGNANKKSEDLSMLRLILEEVITDKDHKKE